MKNILLIIDIQKGFITNNETAVVRDRIDELIDSQYFDYTIATVYSNYENSPITQLMGWKKLMTQDEQQLVGSTQKSDYIVYKNKYSAVNDELLSILSTLFNENDEKCIFVVGVDTECCVLATATDLFEHGIRPIVLSKYCASSSGEDYKRAGLTSLINLIGKNNIFPDFITGKASLEQAFDVSKLHTNDKTPIENIVVSLLKNKGWHISFAESCTGGLATARLINVADASHVLNASHITYANDAKIKYLNVSPDTIAKHGVVSEEVALEMALGVSNNNNSEVGVGISGIAGPSGATLNKPVGMVCFGFYINGQTFSKTVYFGNLGRNTVRESSVEFVYKTLIKHLS